MANQTKFQIIAQALGFDKTKSKVKGLTASMKTFATGLVGAAAAYKALGVGIEAIKLAGKLEGVERGFNNLRKEAGFSANAFNKFDKALDGTVSKLDLMEQANNAMLLGIADSEDQMADMFDVAQRLAQALGQDARFGIESLVTGLGRQSKLMLDNLGIMVDTNGAYEKYAEELGTTVDKLTDAEKKQGVVNEAMRQGKDLVANLGEEVLTSSQRIEQFSTTLDSLKETIGKSLIASGVLQGLTTWAEGLSGVLEIYNKSNTPLETFEQKLLAINIMMEGLDENTNAYLTRGSQMDRLIGSLTNAEQAYMQELFGVETRLELKQALMDELKLVKDGDVLTTGILANAEIEYTAVVDNVNAALEAQLVIKNEMMEGDMKEIDLGIDKIDVKKKELSVEQKLFLANELKNKQMRDALSLGMKTGQQYSSLADLATGSARKIIRSAIQSSVAQHMKQITPFFAWAGPAAPALIFASGAVLSAGLEQLLSKIQFEEGGLVGGRRHSQGGTPIIAEQGEYVMSRNAVESIGVDNLEAMNQGGGGSSVVINNPIISSEFVEEELPNLIAEAVRKGANFGMS